MTTVWNLIKGLVLGDGRGAIGARAKQSVAHRTSFNYNQRRPVRYVTHAPFNLDCSGAIVWLFWLVGCDDPTGNHFSGSNTNTVTLLQHGKRITPSEVCIGDVLICGAELPVAEQHTMLSLERSPNPLCFSHGSQGDPTIVRASIDRRSHTWVRFRTRRIRLSRPPIWQ